MALELDSALHTYMAAIQAFSRLSREEERELWRRWREDLDEQARDTLIYANLRYVAAIAMKYRRYGLPVTELIAEGNFGIVRALTKFEPERGNRFVTYATYWIRAYILDYIVRSFSLVGAGSGVLRSKVFFRLRREMARVNSLLGEGDGDRADEMLAQRFNVSRDKIGEMKGRLEARDISLNSNVFDSEVETLIDTLISSDISQEENYARAQRHTRVKHIVDGALESLDSRERFIVEKRLMADEEDHQSLAQMGRSLGISRERARQLEARAKRKLVQRIFDLSSCTNLDGLTAGIAA